MKAIHSLSYADYGRSRRIVIGSALAFLLMFSSLPGALKACDPESAAQSQNRALNDEEFRLKAEYQYELAKLYLGNGETGKALDAIRQILQPRIPPQYEEAVVKSVCGPNNFADKFKDIRRFDLAQTLLDDLLKVTIQIPNRVTVLQKKSTLYYLAGDNDKAIEYWKLAEAESRRKD